jgi:hypothetical protein
MPVIMGVPGEITTRIVFGRVSVGEDFLLRRSGRVSVGAPTHRTLAFLEIVVRPLSKIYGHGQATLDHDHKFSVLMINRSCFKERRLTVSNLNCTYCIPGAFGKFGRVVRLGQRTHKGTHEAAPAWV